MINGGDFFWFCALSGSILFAVQLTLNLFGALDQDDMDSSGNFKWLSKQGVVGFLMMFGFVGLTCLSEFNCNLFASTICALLGGILTIVITGCIFKLARKLRSAGTVFNIEEAIGKEATVYQEIPRGGTGKVTLSLQGLTHEIDAISAGDKIPSFTPVHIVKKVDHNTLMVIPK